ncbi:hypothetical protein KJ688_04875, partial [bacterium]|nr:hypothetical protein [bacterium]
MIPQSELDHLADLLKDFATQNHYTPETAFTLIKSRFRAFEKSNFIPEICSKLKSIDHSGYPGFFRNFAKIIHHYIYQDILVNAGEYWRSSDPGGGLILFGGQKQRSLESKFKGVSADKIENDLNKAYSWLGENGDPVANVLTQVANHEIVLYCKSYSYNFVFLQLGHDFCDSRIGSKFKFHQLIKTF